MKTIGIIGGMSWTSSLHYYRLINQLVYERLGGSHSAKLVLWSVDFGDHLSIHEKDGWAGVAAEAIDLARKLEVAGAEFLIMAVNTLHRVAEDVEAAVGIPLLHIADATGREIHRRGFRRVGLLGTRHTMNEDFYTRRLSENFDIEVILPDEPDRAEIDRIIFNELVIDSYKESSRATCLRIIDYLGQAGAKGVILGCTELPLLVSPGSFHLPLFDTLELHARAAVDYALSE